MKTAKFFAALVLGIAAVACAPKEAAVEGEDGAAIAPKEMTAKDFLPTKAEKDSVSYLMGINFGSFIKNYNFGDDLNYSEIVKGIKAFVAAEGNMRDPEFNEQFKINPELMNDVFNSYLEKRHNLAVCENREKEEKFLAENRKKDGVEETESGLQYKIINPGNDVKPAAQDTVWVKYCGKLLDGTVFDETTEDAEPVRMQLNRVIKGWTEGLQLVGEGGEIELYIPSNLAYGEQGNQAIEPNSTLIFNVKVDKVGKVAE
ncbi:MAG: FKBP-type peptidyl-prolyl cis-trans isomerase [Bacteroidales bacterium]|nr:FKBP-type peptidyl-prolyl cis-trans isomerase [Bacteroidales bacterium]